MSGRRVTRWSLVGALLLVGCGGGAPQRVEVGARMPAFELLARDGSKLASDTLAGSPAIISFWATWCQPCLKDIPELNQLVAQDGLTVVAISLDAGGWSAVDPFLEKHPLRGTIVLGNEKLFGRFGGFTIPYTLVVDRDQTIRAVFRGPVTRTEVLASLAPG